MSVPASSGDAQAASYIERSGAARESTPLVSRYSRVEESTLNRTQTRSSEFLRAAVHRTKRVEQAVVMRKLVLAHAAGARSDEMPENRRALNDWTLATAEVPAHVRAPSSPPVNVDQIADTVMRQLDRRLVSWRERMGRL
jgi:hypothetical protein